MSMISRAPMKNYFHQAEAVIYKPKKLQMHA